MIGFIAVLLFIGANAQAVGSDEDTVRAVIAKEIAAWNNYDPHQIASQYTSDATWQNPFAVRLHSSAELEKFLTKHFQRPGYRAAKDTEQAKIIDLHFPSPTVAVVWSDESSKGQIDDETGRPMHPRHSYYLEVLVKRDEGWKISECMIMDLITNPQELPLTIVQIRLASLRIGPDPDSRFTLMGCSQATRKLCS